jgi:hypothetical protein
MTSLLKHGPVGRWRAQTTHYGAQLRRKPACADTTKQAATGPTSHPAASSDKVVRGIGMSLGARSRPVSGRSRAVGS